MIFFSKKVALILVLSFLTANADHHDHQNHHDHSTHKLDELSAFNNQFHEYHHKHPIEHPNCGQICPKSLPKFQTFEVGHIYTVELDGETLINVKEGQTVDLKSKVDVHVLSPCEFSLTLRDSKISGVPNPQELNKQLDSSPPLRFGAHDGKILGVCPAPEEEVWTLNVKKSILSALQLTAKDLSTTNTVEEVDFSGHCTTTYRPLSDTSDPSNILLEKTKNLNKCHLRRKNIAGFQSKSLTLLTEFLRENLPILKSSQKCLQEIKSGHLFSVKCTEEQKLSFQDDNLVVSTLNLQFGGKTPAPNPGSAGPVPQNAETLLMSRDDEGQTPSTEADVLSLLKGMCDQLSGDKISPEITESFHALVSALRTLPEAGTRTLDKASKSSEICQSPKLRDLFIGASAFAASDPSIQTLISAYNSKELTETQTTILLTIVALKSRPSDKTIDQFVGLIEPKDSERNLMIGVSLMVRKFCKKTENCLEVPAVKKVVTAITTKLQNSNSNIEKITTIKALDNIRPKTDESVKNILIDLAQKTDADNGVRVAAIQALQRLADDNIRQKLIEILSKDNEPSEVRVIAYRAVVLSGATTQQLTSINSVSEPEIQNYIRTHIKNLKKPIRREVLPQEMPVFEEPTNKGLGVTRNVIWSYKEVTMEIDVIHSKGSLIPSLYSFGIWFPMKGKEYQLLEVQIRQEGLSQHFQKLISRGFSGPEVLMQLSEEILELLAYLRDPSHKHTATVQLSVRMSGNNILFIDTFEDLHRMFAAIKQRLRELYTTDTIDIARAISLLDSQVEVPTIMGFPMLLHLNETIVLAMKADHSVSENGGTKTRTIRSSRTYLDELSAGISLKVRNYRPGFEYHVRFELTPSSDAIFQRIDGRILKAKINLPNERKSLMTVIQNTRLIDGNGVSKENNEISSRSASAETRCRQLFGLNLCASRTWQENSPFPNVEYYITKQDPSLESIELTFEKPAASATRDLLVWSAKVDAGKREYLGQFELRNPREGPKKANLKLVSPIRTITAETSLFNSADGNVSKMEFDLKLPNVLDVNTKYNVEQKGEEKNVDILVEYQCAESDRKELIKWNRKSSFSYKRDKKSKQINLLFLGELKSTQFPEYNTKLSYTSNSKPYQTSKSDLKVEWGPQLAERVRLTSTSKMDIIELRPLQMVSENALVIEATPLDINYDFKLNSDISMIKSKPKILSLDLIGKDVEGRPDRDIKGSLRYERVEEPIQQTINATLVYPGREISYYSDVKQIKDLNFEGKMFYSPQKGKVITIEHKESVTNPTKDFHLKSEGEISYSFKPDRVKFKTEVGWESSDQFEYKYSYSRNGQKQNEWELEYDKKSGELSGEMSSQDKQAKFKIDNIQNPRSAEWGAKYGAKSYKFSAIRVPKESISIKLDSAENSRLKEFKAKISRKDKSTLKLVTNEDLEINGYIDLVSKETAKAHLDVKCPKHQIDHTGDITLSRKERKFIWKSKTNKNGNPWITLDSQLTPRDRSYIILKKIKGPDAVSKFEYFYEKGVYGAVLDTSRWSAILEGEKRNDKNFGKLGFVDKVDNYEHKSQYNISNGILTIRSISDKEKQTFTKLDAVIGLRIISNISLITPKINAQLTANPLGEKKTLVFKLVSPQYDQDTNIEWQPRKYLKIDALSHRKVDPEKRIKLDAYLTRNEESTFRMTAPLLDVDIRRVKTPKPRYIFNTTINGYNEVQEFDSNPSMTPIQNFLIALNKFFESYYADSQ